MENPGFFNKNLGFSFIDSRYIRKSSNVSEQYQPKIHNPKPFDLRRRTTILSLFLLAMLYAKSAPQSSLKDSATIIIRLDNFSNNNEPIDSIYLIFDRFDLTGAGVIKQVCHPVNNAIELTVPKGKYFINIICLGVYKDKHFDAIVNARSSKRNELLLKVDPTSFFIPGLVSFPEEKIDFGNLSVTSYSFRNK